MALYLDGRKVLPICDSASDTTFDDTNVAYEADDVQEALEKVTKSLTYAEYEALTDAEKNNGTIYLITDINGTGDKFQPVIYSEEEREIGVWKNGQPVYAIVLTTSVSKSITTSSWTQLEFTKPIPTNIKEMVRMSFACNTQPNFYEGFRLSWDDGNQYFKMSCDHNGTFPANVSIYIEYTKTTDTAGSGTWTPQGVPAHHYSTDEQVVGTWIDGSTLYEKTKRVAANSSTTITLWTDSSVVVRNYEGAFIIRASGNMLTIWSRPTDNANRATVEGIGNDTTHGIYADVQLGTNRTNKLDLCLTVRYTKSST